MICTRKSVRRELTITYEQNVIGTQLAQIDHSRQGSLFQFYCSLCLVPEQICCTHVQITQLYRLNGHTLIHKNLIN